MSEGQAKKTVTFVDPFTGKKVPGTLAPADLVPVDYNEPDELGLDLDKETGNTKVVSTGKRNIDKEIQQFKDDCGYEGMRKLISQGRATPKDFYDDGKHGMDVAGLPDNLNDAFRAAQAANLDKEQMLNKLGVDEKDGIDETERQIKIAVENYFKGLAAKAAVTEEVKKDETK